MPRIKSLSVLFAIAVGCTAGSDRATGTCSKEQALVAERSVGGIGSWSDLESFFEAHSSCDDGLIAEGLSDRVGFLLERDLEGFIRIANQAPKRDFRQFVAGHLDATLNEDTLRAILRLVENCSERDSEICKELAANAKAALAELADP